MSEKIIQELKKFEKDYELIDTDKSNDEFIREQIFSNLSKSIIDKFKEKNIVTSKLVKGNYIIFEDIELETSQNNNHKTTVITEKLEDLFKY